MNILEKIQRHGIINSIIIFSRKLIVAINKCIFYLSKLLPINDKLVVMESEGDLSDNSYALYDYMRTHGYLDKYKVVWLVNNTSVKNKERFKNTTFVSKLPDKLSFKRMSDLSRCRWYIYDHTNLLAPLKIRSKQQVVYLSHGWGYKASKGGEKKNKTTFDIITTTGPMAAEGLTTYWGESLKKSRITGYPRLDYFFKDNKEIQKKVNKKWNFNLYKKVIFWMPTFRQSFNSELSEDYFNSQTGLPIFETEEQLIKFSDYLKKNDILLVFKLHHLQASLPIYKKSFENILIVKDEMLKKMEIQLYQFIPFADILISDYSSISIDYLLLNRPIIFTLDDYEEYNKSRGLFPKDAIKYMPGYHVYSQAELEESISEIMSGKDKYKLVRNRIINNYHTFKDGNSSKRILNLIGIKNK